jgi:aryl-alcohol dehydrogenase-like predicted oxidoreductase
MNLISKIGLGSVQFGIPYGVSNKDGQTSATEVTKILDCANKCGMTAIDTASAYGNAQEVLGQNDLNCFKIISKFMPLEVGDSIRIQLEKSLSNLKINSLYGYLAHRPLNLIDNPKEWEELLILKQQNKIKKIGLSLNEPRELDLLLNKGMMPDLIQVPYNYFDNRFKDILIDLKARGCEIHTRSTFLQGLFFTDVQKLPSFFDEVKKNINELQINLSDNLPGTLLKHVLSLDFIDVVIMGVENEKQLKSNLTNINASHYLPPNDFNFSDSVLMPSKWPKEI